jgi:hypothetical protein
MSDPNPPVELPPPHLALKALSNLLMSDPTLIFLARELNLYSDVLRFHGQRTYFTPYDLKVCFARMCDLALVSPTEAPNREEPLPPTQPQTSDPGEIQLGFPTNLDEADRATKRLPKFPPRKT